MARCQSRIANLESLEQGETQLLYGHGNGATLTVWRYAGRNGPASPVQLLHNNDTHDGAQWHPTVRVHGVPVTVSAVVQLHVIVR